MRYLARESPSSCVRRSRCRRSGVTYEPSLLRALEVYELERLDFAEAYLVAQAEATRAGAIASFDRSIDRVTSIGRREP